MKKRLFLYFLCGFPAIAFTQNDSIPAKDSSTLQTLNEVIITAFEQNRRLSASAINIQTLNSTTGDRNNRSSLLSGFNSLPGIRMEERSPGSYRINLRGSSIRSPFGVRNVKVYWNGIPVTDPGGNTYFNQFAFNNFATLEIFKGPAGSLYGAGTGGLILMNSIGQKWAPGIDAAYITGSYGLQNIFVSGRFGKEDNRNQVTYAHNQTNGYRDHTAMRRDNVSWVSKLKASGKQQLTASMLYTDMYYQTPGALTLAEYKVNAKAARPAAGGFPSADKAMAAIYQKNALAGITNEQQILPSLKNTTTVYGAFALIENPTVRNYEKRREPHAGGRSSFTWKKDLYIASSLQLVAGTEIQQGFFNTRVSGNVNGKPDTLQTDDDIRYRLYSIFGQADLDYKQKIFISAGVSVNSTKVKFTRLNMLPVNSLGRTYRNEYAPRISIMGKPGANLSLGASVAKGFSPPSIAELLPSTGVISTGLEAETGTNYELTARQTLLNRSLQLELNLFYFRLHNALVQRRDINGADYYVNAGQTKQKGLEFGASYHKTFGAQSLLQSLSVSAAYTYNDFRYANLFKDTANFSGKYLPSVPAHTLSATADLVFKQGIYLSLTQFYASGIYLNDANTAKADDYELLGARSGWRSSSIKFPVDVYIGIDNLLNRVYSLGNDINDPRGRYYNTAPGRNFYIGLNIGFAKRQKA